MTSFLGKNWVVHNRELKQVENLKDFHDPFLFEDMARAVERIKQAISNKERIMIFGDYDVDGISSTVIMLRTLRSLNAKVSCRLPNRVTDGYGLSMKYIDEFIEKDIKLIITVDNGISCTEQVKKAKEAGIDTIITDHHQIPEVAPDPHSIIHTQKGDYPFKELAGAGVALKLAQALIPNSPLLTELTNLAALGTVADLVPLLDENRLIVRHGIANMQDSKLAGIQELLKLSNITPETEMDAQSIGFRIAPRINASGRIGDPHTALRLLLHEDQNPEVLKLSAQLENLNNQRRTMTEEAFLEVEKTLNKDNLPSIIIAHHKDWHVGILGLLAGKIVEKYGRPAVIMQKMDGKFVGSARSNELFNITEALTHTQKHLINFGGHFQAAGFNLEAENFEEFKKDLTAYSEEALRDADLKPILNIDNELFEDDLSFEFIEGLEGLKPFGVGNEKPVFILRDIEPQSISQVGKERTHLSFSIHLKEGTLRTIGFNIGDHAEELKKHQKIDIACYLEKNIWNGKESLQLQILDLRAKKP
ncbi:single-stranded-DNA-specific exonuclease RecJ [Patescibacteria group bacterium]|nr:single-stranded-DNA-specific exonuclease RecJ [Patescibacteria group bacterium]